MIRFYRAWAKQLLQMLIHFKTGDPNAFTESSFTVRTAGQSGEETIALLEEMLAAEPIEADLIDQLVRIIGLPHLENRVSRGMLVKLRQALLIPSELRQAVQVMNESWFCDNCRAPFDAGDLLVARRVTGGPEGSTCLVLYCARCVQPDYYRCRLNHQVPVSSAFTRVLRKLFDTPCEICARGAAQVEPESRPPSEPMAIRIVQWSVSGGSGETETSSTPGYLSAPPTSFGRSPVTDWTASLSPRGIRVGDGSLSAAAEQSRGADSPYEQLHRRITAEIAAENIASGSAFLASPTFEED